jgi:glycosyltransferase involved in cell wall biosynthesis
MDTNTTPRILIALPAKNESAAIGDTLQRIKSAIGTLRNYTFDIVVFDDASTDNTKSVAEQSGAVVVTNKNSRGLGYVFTTITDYFLQGKWNYLVTIDADGQFEPKEIPLLLEALCSGNADFVTGSRFLKGSKTHNISWVKKFGNRLGSRYISSILKKRYSDVTCGFRAYTHDAILRLHTFSDFTYTQEVFLNLGIKKLFIAEVPITTHYFAERKSKMVGSIIGYMLKSFKIILKFMMVYAPMRLFSRLGNMSFIIAILCGVFVYFWDHTTGAVTPYKWLGITGLVSGLIGILMYSVGILLQVTSRIQLTIEEGLYFTKKYGKNNK